MSIVDRFSLAGKNALVTGATGNLGSAMAWSLAEAGGTVLVNSRSQSRCDKLVEQLNDAGLAAEPAVFDVTDHSAVARFFALREDKPLHCLVNNAYLGGAGTVKTASPEAYTKSYDVSVVSAHVLLKEALPSLRLAVRNDGDASVINIASMYGMRSPDPSIYGAPEATNPPFYGAAKAALIHWTRYSACEFGPEGIRFNAISPGPFPAEDVRLASPEFVSRLARKVPLQRVGEAHELQGLVLLLASPASTFINGANIPVDGGWTSW